MTTNDAGTCQRTLALYRPGVPLPGVAHHFAWTGAMPCTGVLRCTLCGQRVPDQQRAKRDAWAEVTA